MGVTNPKNIEEKTAAGRRLKLVAIGTAAKSKTHGPRNFFIGVVLLLLFMATWTIPLSPSALRTTKVIFGIVGTLLMISTELFYTLRKEGRFKRGSIKTWLRIHITTGLIGPAMVIWHADFHFPGVAGALTYMTITVVISGFIGRYIYRRLPKTIKGRAKNLTDIVSEEARVEQELSRLLSGKPKKIQLLAKIEHLNNYESGDIRTLWHFDVDYYRHRLHLERQLLMIGKTELDYYRELRNLIASRLYLERSIKQLNASKNLLARWMLFHKPLTLTMFALIGAHVFSTFYYGRVI